MEGNEGENIMNSKIKSVFADRLFEYILTMNTVEECYQLFEDLCTVHEINAVAEMLDKKCTYIEIAEKTGASTATISRVNRSLIYGTDGYKLAFERLAAKKEIEEETKSPEE